jgi:uncharacterized membrane protein YsdA (DUF1294 family)/cold shock CspA family protein
MRHQGRIVVWKDDKGYGFIASDAGGPQAFVHIKAFANRRRKPKVGDGVSYDVATDLQNKLRAGNVQYVDDVRRKARREVAAAPNNASGVLAATAVALGFLALLIWHVVQGASHFLVPLICTLLSLVTFMVYAFDKSAAMNRRWRTSETTMQMLALLGGWPGALVAQQLFHHKSRKLAFQATFRFFVLINVTAYLAWSTERGRAWASAVLDFLASQAR